MQAGGSSDTSLHSSCLAYPASREEGTLPTYLLCHVIILSHVVMFVYSTSRSRLVLPSHYTITLLVAYTGNSPSIVWSLARVLYVYTLAISPHASPTAQFVHVSSAQPNPLLGRSQVRVMEGEGVSCRPLYCRPPARPCLLGLGSPTLAARISISSVFTQSMRPARQGVRTLRPALLYIYLSMSPTMAPVSMAPNSSWLPACRVGGNQREAGPDASSLARNYCFQSPTQPLLIIDRPSNRFCNISLLAFLFPRPAP
ncbi:hypothetical protein LZ31DRAFT_148494 [Colletotrichum somersetense]|nr:hypothetical protein LZ31DRAFT_148494 [Colletotrichum somersetense]